MKANYNRDEMLRKALTRLEDLYSRCIESGNEKRALDVQREINRLTGLYPPANANLPHEVANEEMDAAASCLHSLGLAPETQPLREHARLAVQKIRELEHKRKDV